MAMAATTAAVSYLPSPPGATTKSVNVSAAATSAQLRSSFLGSQLSEAQCKGVQSASPRLIKKAQQTILIEARKTASRTNFEVEIDKPLGITIGPKQGGGVVITGVRGNAEKAGLKVGDQIVYTSSFFGDELWPADNVAFTRTALQAKPDSVYFVINRNADVDVKKLNKKPAPPRFGRNLTAAQKERATHICLDCGYIYTLTKPFDEQPNDYACPQCRAPKKRFARYDAEKGRAIMGGVGIVPVSAILGVLLGAGLVGGLLFYGLQ